MFLFIYSGANGVKIYFSDVQQHFIQLKYEMQELRNEDFC